MLSSSKQEEIKILKGYVNFSPQARILETRCLWEKASTMEPSDSRAILYLIAVESFFMQQETLYKFLKATKAASEGKDYLGTLIKTRFNPQDIDSINSPRDLNLKYPKHLTAEEREKVEKRISGIIKTCKTLKEPNKKLMPIYYALKHGFMFYKTNEGILPLLHKEKGKRLAEYFEELGVKPDKNAYRKSDFTYLIDLNRRVASAIKDVIAVRLVQLDVSRPD